MSITDYHSCTTFEEVAELAVKNVEADGSPWVSNFCVKAQFPANLLATAGLPDAEARAKLWQQTSCPEELFFSHGEYLGADGIAHIARELKAKPSSNRALASLISVKDIAGSADRPLPSFLVFQCTINDQTLYATAIYRAMEVKHFFRINLEEIRLMAQQVYEVNRSAIKQIALCVFATRAYIKDGMNTLERCEIDRLSQLDLMRSHHDKLPALLREKSKHSTFPETVGLEQLLAIAQDEDLPVAMQVPGNSEALRSRLKKVIAYASNLRSLRETSSHHGDIEDLEARLSAELDKLADDIDDASKAVPA